MLYRSTDFLLRLVDSLSPPPQRSLQPEVDICAGFCLLAAKWKYNEGLRMEATKVSVL